MMLRVRLVVISLLVALPVALLVTYLISRGRAADQQLALQRVVMSQLNAQVRERCESDPTWFLTGPLDGRPAGGVFVETGPDQLPPRPRTYPQPFELFAYDEAFVGSSPASARFPPDFKRALRADSEPVFAPYTTGAGSGVQMAVATGWINGSCAYFLGRMEAPPGQARQRDLTFVGLYVLTACVVGLSMFPLVYRIRRQADVARESVRAGFTPIAPDTLKDELSSLTFVHNDLSNELQERKTRIDDQDVALRRLVQSTEDEIARPLALLESGLGRLASSPGDRDALVTELVRAHDLSGAVENLAATARLRLTSAAIVLERVDGKALVDAVISRAQAFAHAAGVTIRGVLPPEPVSIDTDQALLARAIANVVDNAVRYNVPGGEVHVRLDRVDAERRFRLSVTDNGAGVSEEEFRGLTAIRRFRGDEGRNRRPGAPGLGLAVAREVADRLGLTLDLKRPAPGGFEVEFSGPLAAHDVQ